MAAFGKSLSAIIASLIDLQYRKKIAEEKGSIPVTVPILLITWEACNDSIAIFNGKWDTKPGEHFRSMFLEGRVYNPLLLLQKLNLRNRHICNVPRTFSIANFNSFAMATVDLNPSNSLLDNQRATLSQTHPALLHDIEDDCYVDKGLRLFPNSSRKA